ncbi:MAG: trehalose-phosphatase [Desulfuromonadales bacterium]
MSLSQIPSHFWQQLAKADHPVLLLDYDGTLAPFRVDRDKAVPYPGLRRLLGEIHTGTVTRLVIISGRAIDDLLPLLGLDPPPEIWGCHGWERMLSNVQRSTVALPAGAQAGLKQAIAMVGQNNPDRRYEVKPASVAIHWRGLPDEEQNRLRCEVGTHWEHLALRYGLQVHAFDGGLELRCPGRDKGTAIREIFAEEETGTPLAFLGDDLTDEDGFREVKGRGLGILVRTKHRPTQADIHLQPPEELFAFLEMWRATVRSTSALRQEKQ